MIKKIILQKGIIIKNIQNETIALCEGAYFNKVW